MPWNGSKGGVFAINVINTLTLNANIDVSENGFRGATNTPTTISMICGITDFCMAPNLAEAAPEGEGITNISTSKSYGRGKRANGGGGLNDVFLPLYYCNFQIKYFFAFNHWGQRVFSTNNTATGWDDTENGQSADMGVYFWYIEGTTADNRTIIRKGDVTLMR